MAIRFICLVKWVALLSILVVVGTVIVGAGYLKSYSRANHIPADRISGTITWRLRLFGRKAIGDIPDLSWSELFQMARHRGGFGLKEFVQGQSLNGAVHNAYDSNKDHEIASHIFSARCAQCHGQEGAGGVGPPLNQPVFSHGDTALDIYKVLRNGIPNTAMRPQSLSMVQRWQLVGYVTQLQFHASLSSAGKAPLKIMVTDEQVLSAGTRTDEWLTYSGSLEGNHYTPLKQITSRNASELRLRWVRQFNGASPNIEATPIVADGAMFITEFPPGSIAVDAVNAKTGDLVWKYSRNISSQARGCCGFVNRGLAILGRYLYLASYDGYLVCINADNGKQVWQTQVADPSHGYTLTGAPLIVNRSVVVGVAGGEFGIRGFLAAYDAETGRNLWRFNTIPGPGEAGHDTWSGDSWRTGGGPTWVTGSYDPSLGLIYWGVGNPSPNFSGASRIGDNLYTNSVIALHGNTGKIAWYFQFTPHGTHDWDSAQTPVLADIAIRGKNRKVMCWPNRNGFYYVLDRVTGKFLTGLPFAKETWAKGLSPTGRPIRAGTRSFSSGDETISPDGHGDSNYQNPALDQRRGLIFVPVTESTGVFSISQHVSYTAGAPFLGSNGVGLGTQIPVVRALDAATGRRKWQYFPTRRQTSTYSGLLATGGGLVFGASCGSAFALDSSTGHQVWRVFLGGNTEAAPISFTVNGRQVVAISAGNVLFLFGL